MNWEVIAYGSGDMLRMIFTAIASIFGNSDYKAAMQTAGMLGFVTVLFKAAFDRNVMANFRWFIGTIVLIMVVLVPKTTVIVNDRITPANSAVVNNVPIGLAATAGFFSFVGDWLARSFETVFSMPNEVKYTTTGLLFPHKLYEATRKMGFPDDRTNNNFKEFFASCVVVDGIGHRRFTWREVMEAPNLMNFFDTRVAVNAASFRYTAGSGTESILPCRSGFTNTLKPDMLALYTDVIKYGVEGDLISRFDSANAASTRMQADMQNAINFMTGVSLTPQQFVTQQAIINAMATGTHKLSQETDATEFNQYIVSGAELHRLTTYQALGDIASEKLPLLRTIFEAIIYAIFPIIVLMAIVIPAKVPMAYITALVWINLWAPMYAILHFIMSYYSQSTMTEIAALYGNGFSVLANAEMAKFNSDVVATTGYLATALPMLAWMLVSKSGAMAASFAGRVMQGYDQSVEKGANEAVDGQGQRMGTKWEQTGSGGIQNSNLMDSGSRQTSTVDGNTILSQTSSQLMVTPQITEQTVQAKQQALDTATEMRESTAARLGESNTSVLSNSGSVLQQLSQQQGANNNFKQSETAQQQQNFTALKGAVDEWAKTNGVEMSDQAKAAMYGAIEGKITAEVGTPLKGIFGSGASTSITTRAGGNIEGSTSETERDAYNMAEKFMNSEQFSSVTASIGAGVREMAAQFGVSENNSAVDQLSTSLSRQQAAQSEYSQAASQVQSARESLSATEALSSVLSGDGSQTLVQALLKSNNGDVGRVDSMLREAAGGSSEAMQSIKFALVDADERFGMGADPQFEQVQQALLNDGRNAVASTFSSGTSGVNSQGEQWRSGVDGQATVTQEQVQSATTAALEAQQAAMNDPSSVITQNGNTERLQRLEGQVDGKGESTQEKVEAVAYINEASPTPFAAMWFNEGQRDQMEGDLKENIQERTRRRSGGE